jgi:hypothetical protein
MINVGNDDHGGQAMPINGKPVRSPIVVTQTATDREKIPA